MEQILQRPPRFLRLTAVRDRTGLSRSTIYRLVTGGLFPRQVSLGPRCVGWLEADVNAWLESRLNPCLVAGQASARKHPGGTSCSGVRND